MAKDGREVFVGIDVGKDRLDVHTSGRSGSISWSTMTKRGWPSSPHGSTPVRRG